jgi:hypothetical protein
MTGFMLEAHKWGSNTIELGPEIPPPGHSNPKFQIILPLRPHLVNTGLVWPTVKRWQHLPLPIDDPTVRKGIPHLFHSDLFSEQGRPPGGPSSNQVRALGTVNLKTLWEQEQKEQQGLWVCGMG